MLVKVIKPFRDKVTKKVHKLGSEIEMTSERIEEISKKGEYIETLEKDEPVAKTKKKQK